MRKEHPRPAFQGVSAGAILTSLEGAMRPVRSNIAAFVGQVQGLGVVARDVVTPRGPRFDPWLVRRRPVRALRGGLDGLGVAFGVRGGRVEIRVLGAAAIDDEAAEVALRAARDLLGLDDDATAFLDLARQHPLVAALAATHDARLSRTVTVFEAFTVAVVEQLVTVFEARASLRRLWAIAGEPVAGSRLRAAPTPEAVRDVPMWRLRESGIGSRRAATLRSGALRGAALERLRELPGEVVIERLQSLRGVGPWTANHVARGALGYADAVPVGDVHAHYVVTEALTGARGGDAAMLRALEPFRPHRARVVALLERSLFGGSGFAAVRGPHRPRIDRHRREPWRY